MNSYKKEYNQIWWFDKILVFEREKKKHRMNVISVSAPSILTIKIRGLNLKTVVLPFLMMYLQRKEVTTPGMVDKIYCIVTDNWRVGISCEWVENMLHENLEVQSLTIAKECSTEIMTKYI